MTNTSQDVYTALTKEEIIESVSRPKYEDEEKDS